MKDLKHIKILFFAFCFFIFENANASHYRAGEIIYSHVSGNTYEITVNTYTDPNSPADPNTIQIIVSFGDQTSATVIRDHRDNFYINGVLVPYIVLNVYKVTHTYSSGGSYTISMYDQNRVDGIVNINFGNSGLTPFYIQTYLNINDVLGPNNSPNLTVPPIDEGCGGYIFKHNPGASDPDGDSLYYELITPMQSYNIPVPHYTNPEGSCTIDHATGEVVWDKPNPVSGANARTYNIAINIREYRRGILIGSVERDMQIRIENCINNPPLILQPPSFCKGVNTVVTFNVSASDNIDKNQVITMNAYGAPFGATKNLATFGPNLAANPITETFAWLTDCRDIRYEPFQINFKATDNGLVPLSDFNLSNIYVIGPAPLNVRVKQSGNGFNISWNSDICGLAAYYKIYKRIDSSHWNPAVCERGVPSSLFTFLDSVNIIANPNATTYFDDNKGKGLTPLVRYCYRIVAVFPARDGQGNLISLGSTSDSYASGESCGAMIRSKPIITNVSVLKTNILNGATFIHWLRPDTLDTTNYSAPFNLVFARSKTETGRFAAFDSISYANFSSMTDSSIIDSNINTNDSQYFYKIYFNSTTPGNYRMIDSSPVASSVRAIIYCTDRTNILSWNYNVPWTNNYFIIYRKDSSNNFDSIGITDNMYFADTGLYNGKNYCYYIQTVGGYSGNIYNTILFNNSQQICGTPLDTIKPCSPFLTVLPPCNSFNDFRNILSWVPHSDCSGDVVYYNIYFKRLKTDPYILLARAGKDTLQYIDTSYILKNSIAGCYVVTGVDSSNNESLFDNEVCIDNCPEYRLPNVFTPNGDSINDFFIPFPYRFVDKIDITIYDRWGLQVFHTNNININWDAKDQQTGVKCSAGVYFYICDVYEIFLEGVRKRTITGTIQIIYQ